MLTENMRENEDNDEQLFKVLEMSSTHNGKTAAEKTTTITVDQLAIKNSLLS